MDPRKGRNPFKKQQLWGSIACECLDDICQVNLPSEDEALPQACSTPSKRRCRAFSPRPSPKNRPRQGSDRGDEEGENVVGEAEEGAVLPLDEGPREGNKRGERSVERKGRVGDDRGGGQDMSVAKRRCRWYFKATTSNCGKYMASCGRCAYAQSTSQESPQGSVFSGVISNNCSDESAKGCTVVTPSLIGKILSHDALCGSRPPTPGELIRDSINEQKTLVQGDCSKTRSKSEQNSHTYASLASTESPEDIWRNSIVKDNPGSVGVPAKSKWSLPLSMLQVFGESEGSVYIDPSYLALRHGPGPSARGQEKRSNFLDASMRAILVSWLFEVAEEFDLSPSTLHLTVRLLDRFLSVTRAVPPQQLQLIGMTALLIASKYEEIQVPPITQCTDIAANCFTNEDVLQMEMALLTCLDYRVRTPTAYSMLVLLSGVLSMPHEIFSFACFLVDLSLLDYSMLRVHPSDIACAAIALACRYCSHQQTLSDLASLVDSGATKASSPCGDSLMALVAKSKAALRSGCHSKFHPVLEKYDCQPWFPLLRKNHLRNS